VSRVLRSLEQDGLVVVDPSESDASGPFGSLLAAVRNASSSIRAATNSPARSSNR
jgi:DNA-binding MarR family transcriptional regulator